MRRISSPSRFGAGVAALQFALPLCVHVSGSVKLAVAPDEEEEEEEEEEAPPLDEPDAPDDPPEDEPDGD